MLIFERKNTVGGASALFFVCGDNRLADVSVAETGGGREFLWAVRLPWGWLWYG